jgi:hypothetical protein
LYIKDPLVVFSFVVLFPGLVTNVAPGMVVYPFVPTTIFAVVVLSKAVIEHTPAVDEADGKIQYTWRTIAGVASRLVFRQLIIFTFCVGIQMGYNYSMLFFQARTSYTEVILTDYTSRIIACAFEQLRETSASAWHLFYAQMG